MSSVICTNPACAQTIRLPDDAPTGKVYGCPHCKQPLPPVPVPEAEFQGGWLACAVLTALIAVAHLAAFAQADSAVKQAAASAAAAAWTVSIYVFARCVEKAVTASHRGGKGN